MRTIDTQLISVTRRQNTTSGNPRYRLTTSEGMYHVEPDAQVNHEIGGLTIGGTYRLVLNKKDNVVGVGPALMFQWQGVPIPLAVRDDAVFILNDQPPRRSPCMWFARCTNQASATEAHPILGDVPICTRCAAKVARLRG